MKKNRVKKAKNISWVFIPVAFIICTVTFFGLLKLWNYGIEVSHCAPCENEETHIQFLSSLTSILFSILIYSSIYDKIWDKIKNQKIYYQNVRGINHYNLCLKHIENNNYQKALKIYNEIFKGEHRESSLSLALKVLNKESLKDEMLNVEDITCCKK